MPRAAHTMRRRGARLLAACLLLAILLPSLSQRAYAGGTVIRVGYTDMSGVTVDEAGNHGGYAVDYLEALAKYTGWEYEYVCDTWENALDRTRQGELDLLVMVRYTEERGESLLFSELAVANDYTALYAAAGSDIYFRDYGAFDGCRVGVTAGTVYAESCADYAREHGLDFELVYFGTDAQASAALRRGDIELLATSGFAAHSGVKLADGFALAPAYLAAGPENRALMDELDAAAQEARLRNRDLETDLLDARYASGGQGADLYLTREEQAYLDAAGPIVVKSFDGRPPMGYTGEDGAFVGILPDYLDMLGEVTGLEFVYEAAEALSLEESAALMAEEGFVLLHTDQSLEGPGLGTALYKTDALFQTELSYVRRQENYVTKSDPHTFSVNRAMGYVGDMLLETNAQSTVLYFDTSQACMEAVLDGRAEMAILDEHVADYLLQKPRFSDHLTRVPGSGAYAEGMCLYAPEAHRPLVGILNKALGVLSEERKVNTLANATLAHSYRYQMDDLLYEYENVIWISCIFVVVTIILGSMLYARAVKLRLQKKENEALQEQVQLDELTGLYNRTAFFERAGALIEGGGDGLCIVRLNVCHFKIVNDLCGTEKGDQLLREIGAGLKELCRREGFIAGRFTADHFYLCIDEDAFSRIGFPRRSAAPWLGMDISLTYGVYPVADRDIPVSAMCDRADMAVASNKNAAQEYICRYSDASRQQLLQEQEIESEMEQAVAQRQFCIYIQPKHNIETEEIVGGEALVRWMHPQKGMIPPGAFIGLFERNGFILKLDHYIWEESCRFLAEAKAKGLPAYPLSVNVSRIHFYGMELQDKLLELLDRYGLQAGDLELEITEGICSEEPEVIFSKCEELRRLGFRIAMDDFGSGYSSLNMLKEMPLDIIKMDLRFLSGDEDAAQREKGHSILRTLIQLAHTLELQVVVEGLETREQRDFIRTTGSCSAQGYYYAKPVDCRTYESMLRRAAGGE